MGCSKNRQLAAIGDHCKFCVTNLQTQHLWEIIFGRIAVLEYNLSYRIYLLFMCEECQHCCFDLSLNPALYL